MEEEINQGSENLQPEQQSQQPSMDSQTDALSPASPEYPYATFLQRWLAYVIDLIILGIVIGTLFSVLAYFLNAINENLVGIIGPLPSVLIWGYFVYMDVKYGATLGKKALGLRVKNELSDENLTWGEAILREVIGKFLSGAALGLGYYWVIWDDKKQGWHDKLGKSVVVKVK